MIKYIWIDALTIIQDDPDDLLKELARMPDIYRYANVTISASSAKNVHEGFLQDRGYYYRNTPPFNLKYRSKKNQIGTLTITEGRTFNLVSPIDTRAWTYQERMLSTRLLDFATGRVIWICKKIKKDEFEEGIGLELEGAYRIKNWRKAVNAFCKRQLTYPDDKLKAISAIAESLRSATWGKYLAGIWEMCLFEELCWMVVRPSAYSSVMDFPQATTYPRPREYRAPSWSWAAVDVGDDADLYLSHIYHQAPSAEILAATVSQDPPNTTFGMFWDGKLVINGRLRAFTWPYNQPKFHLNRYEFLSYPDAKEADWSDEGDASVEAVAFILAKGKEERNLNGYPDAEGFNFWKCGFILVQAPEGTYRRVGFFHCQYEESEERDTFYGFHTDTVTIL